MTVDGPDERLDIAPHGYRLAQEALHNRVKHAAHRGEVHLDATVARVLTRSLVAPRRESPR